MNTYEYSVAPENIDFRGQITVPSLCRDIINAIGQNIRVEGYGIDVMARERRSWVLLRSAFEIDSRPGLYAPLQITVWPVSSGGITYNRCVRVTGRDGKEVGRGTTEWCIIDIDSRRPLFPELAMADSGLEIPCRSPKRIRDFSADFSDNRIIRYSDCDFNGHLNNTRYLEMMYDMLPEEAIDGDSPIRLDFNYRHEARRGEDISLGLKKENGGECLFYAKSADVTLCSASLTRS